MGVSPASVITIGNFDGVHLGHAALVRRARRVAEEIDRADDGRAAGRRVETRAAGATRVVALAFDPHPAAALAPGSAPAVVTGWSDRRALLLAAGADEVKRLTPTPELLSLSPGAFLDRVCAEWNAVGIVEGHDFHFGRGRAGTPEVLSEYGAARGLRVEIVAPVLVDLCDQTVVRASSTVVRWLLEQGRVTDVHRVLGRAHRVSGEVVKNDQRGRTLGFPTANLDPSGFGAGGPMLPRDGVYAALAHVPGEAAARAAAVHIGPRATFGSARRVVEAHVIGWGGPGAGSAAATEYGWRLGLDFLAPLREPMRFESVEAIRAQLARDVERAAEIAGRYRGGWSGAARGGWPAEVRGEERGGTLGAAPAFAVP